MIFIVGKNGFLAKQIINSHQLVGDIKVTSHNLPKNSPDYLNLQNPKQFDYSKINLNDIVLLLGGISKPDICYSNYAYAYKINVTGTEYFINRCLERDAKVIFPSSDVVYGETANKVNESDKIDPIGPYAEMKAIIEDNFKEYSGFKTLRFSYIFSNKDKFTKYVLKCIVEKKRCEVYDPFSRSVVYINDIIDGIVNLCEKWEITCSSIINFCGPYLLSRIDYVEIFQQYFPNILPYDVVEPESSFYKARPKTIHMESKYLTKLLGREPTSLYNAIKNEIINGELKCEL